MAKVLNLNITQYCPNEYHAKKPSVSFVDELSGEYDVVITDAWPPGFSDEKFSLTENLLAEMANPMLLPTPPVTIGKELLFSPASSKNFSGYKQKSLLLPVQKALISYLLSNS